jgi:hypothetical protein
MSGSGGSWPPPRGRDRWSQGWSHLQARVCGEDRGLVIYGQDGDGEGHWVALAFHL